MGDIVVPFSIGLLLIALGISNYRGNINSLHSYHRNRIAEEDKKVFAEKVGTGTILSGIGIMLQAGFALLVEISGNDRFMLIGSVVGGIVLFLGIVISLVTIIKYNKGLF